MKRQQKKKRILRSYPRYLGEVITLADVCDSLGISKRGDNRDYMFAHPESYGWFVEPLSNNNRKRRHYPMRRGV